MPKEQYNVLMCTSTLLSTVYSDPPHNA